MSLSVCFMSRFVVLIVWFFWSHVQASNHQDLILVDINQLGFAQVNQLKSQAEPGFWMELGGELMLMVPSAQKLDFGPKIQARLILKDVDPARLFLEVKGLCHSHQHHDIAPSQANELSHLYIDKQYHILQAKSPAAKQGLLSGSDCYVDLVPNHQLYVQAANMVLTKNVNQTDGRIVNLLSEVDQDRWFEHVKFLSSHHRLRESALTLTGNWLTDQFEGLGLETRRLERPQEYVGFSVIGTKAGTTRPNDWYVVGAHLDSMNTEYAENLGSPGAEDNASGCAGVLELASVLADYETEATIVFVCFAGHETSRVSINNPRRTTVNGSLHMVNDLLESGDLSKVKAMFNLDMISYHDGGEYTGQVSNAHPISLDLLELFLARAQTYTDIQWTTLLNWTVSDHRNFSRNGVPSLMSSETSLRSYFAYHLPQDRWENLDPYLGEQIIKANLANLALSAGAVIEANNRVPIVAMHSGLWYDPEQSGHGLSVMILPNNRMAVQWYVFDDVGEPMWLIGVGEYAPGGDVVTLELSLTENGRFPPHFDSDAVTVQPWGQMQIEFHGCHSGLVQWEPNSANAQFTAGSMPLTRLSLLSGLTVCDE